MGGDRVGREREREMERRRGEAGERRGRGGKEGEGEKKKSTLSFAVRSYYNLRILHQEFVVHLFSRGGGWVLYLRPTRTSSLCFVACQVSWAWSLRVGKGTFTCTYNHKEVSSSICQSY